VRKSKSSLFPVLLRQGYPDTMIRNVPTTIKQAWEDLQHASSVQALAACRRLREELSRWEGALANEARLDGASWEVIGHAIDITRQSAWERYQERRAAAVMRHSDVVLEDREGEQLLISSGEILRPVAAGVQLSDTLIPWSGISRIRRYLRSDEPHNVAFQHTRFGVEVRTPISVALYPKVNEMPEEWQAEARSLIREGHKAQPWIFARN
jgi:hypothetical protein